MTVEFRPTLLLASSLLLCSSTAVAQIGPGNILVSENEMLNEYTPEGVLVDSRSIPYPTGDHPISESARDSVRDEAGDIHVFNGTFDPYLTTLRVETESWEHHTHPQWDTANNVSYGGIGVVGDYIFVTDNLGVRGIFRFDQKDFSVELFPDEDSFGFIDLTIGRDGLLYALESTEYRVRVFDPETLAELDFLYLSQDVRGIAVDSTGEIYGASWDGRIYHFDPAGTQLNSLHCGVGSLCDIDIDAFGNLVISSRFGSVVITDTSLQGQTGFSAGAHSFVAFSRGSAPGAGYCTSLPNSTGEPAVLTASGSNSVGAADLTLFASPIPDDFYIFFIGSEETQVPFGNGLLCVTNGFLRYPPAVAVHNVGMLDVFPGDGLDAGSLVYFQCWFRDQAGGGERFNTSDGYVVKLVP